MPERIGDWILTFTGVEFYPLDPRPQEVNIVDIAHALSMKCRFTGHTREFYSVAEHSYWVSMLVPTKYALAALLHDASEAYLCDVARPVKHLPEMFGYRRAEFLVTDAIRDKFKLPADSFYTKTADDLMLSIEAKFLMPDHPCWGALTPIPEKYKNFLLAAWSHTSAEMHFLRRFKDLTGAL